mgnify:CR=1 FL=1
MTGPRGTCHFFVPHEGKSVLCGKPATLHNAYPLQIWACVDCSGKLHRRSAGQPTNRFANQEGEYLDAANYETAGRADGSGLFPEIEDPGAEPARSIIAPQDSSTT